MLGPHVTSPTPSDDLRAGLASLAEATEEFISEDGISSDTMGIVMLASLRTQLAEVQALLTRLYNLEASRIPTGDYPWEQTVTEKVEVYFPNPLISLTLVNDGPSQLFLAVNSDTVEEIAPVLAGESFTYDAIYPVVQFLTLSVPADGSAEIRLRSKTGRSLS